MTSQSPPAQTATGVDHPPRWQGWVAAGVTVTIWTAFIVIARASADPARQPTLGPMDIFLARLLGASLILVPLGWWLTRRKNAQLRAQGTGGVAGSLFGLSPLPLNVTVRIGLTGGLLYGLLAYSGFAYAPAAHASVLMPGSLPLWTALLAVWLLGERITPARATGLLFIVAGDLLVGGASLLHAFDGGNVWRGDIIFMVASLTWSLYSVLVRRYALQAVEATTAITVFSFVSFLPAYVLAAWLGWVQPRVLTAPVSDVLLQMVMQGVLSVVVSGISFNIMIRHFGPVRSTMMTAVVPGMSALAAALFLGEPLPWNVLLGLTLVTAGIVFGVRRAAVSAPPTAVSAPVEPSKV